MDNSVPISAVILTKNEEQNIERCLQSLSFCEEIIVIDDYSSDKTVEISRKFETKVVERGLKNDFTSQRNFGMEQARGEWILFIDADEEVSERLQKEIVSAIKTHVLTKKAYFIPRRDFWWGGELKYGEVYRARKQGFIRLVRKNSGHWAGKVHEKYVVESIVGHLHGYIRHYPHPTVKEFISEVNMYSTIRAKELFSSKIHTNIFEIMLFPFGKFIWNYFLQFGFLDGPAGFVYSFFMSFHSFLVRAKLYQYYLYPKTS